jgi:hypothetical protein
MCASGRRDRDAEGRVFLRVRGEQFGVQEREVLEILEAVAVGGDGTRGEVFVEGEMGSGCRVDGFAVLAFSSGAAVDEEREGDGENEEDEDCDGGYYAAVQTGVGVCWCVFETERRRGRGLR